MRDYLLSVIIPTKNRQYYCLNSVKQILSCYGDSVEIVVQDNSDEPSLEEQIRQLGQDNVVYHYVSGVLSFVDNFDLAIRAASGKYLMLIGDDDGVTSLAYKAAKWAEENDVSAIRPALSFVYFWPGSKVFESDDNGKLDIYSYGGTIREYDSLEGVKKLLKKSCQSYLDGDLIKMYHGIVRRDLLDSIEEKTGKYVGGLSPDIYLSVALSLSPRGKVMDVDVPLTISGICAGSGSSQTATGEHTGKLEDAPHFRGHDHYDWDVRVPRFYSAETIWGDSALAAVKDMAPEYLEYYKAETLVYRCLRKYPAFKKEIMSSYLANKGSRIRLACYAVSRVFNRLVSHFKTKKASVLAKKYEGVISIEKASELCEAWINENSAFAGY